MKDWQEMYVWPYAPHDREVDGLTPDGHEVTCRFHPVRQTWVDGEGQQVVITHWRERLSA